MLGFLQRLLDGFVAVDPRRKFELLRALPIGFGVGVILLAEFPCRLDASGFEEWREPASAS